MKVLVTGGCGFIGSNFIRRALRSNADVTITNVDALTYAADQHGIGEWAEHPRCTFVHGDITDAALLAAVVPGHDAVVNFAAETHVDRSISRSQPFVATNVVGAHAVFDAAMRADISRCLQVSTDEVYGSVEAPARRDEDAPLAPSSPYAATKASADLIAQSYAKTYGYPITITRSCNAFGPYQFVEKVVPTFITNLIDGEPLPLYGDGINVRSWLPVEDNVAAQWLALTAGEPGAIYNVDGGVELTNHALALRILAAFGRGEDSVCYVPDRPGHDLRYAADAARIRALGWRPQTAFDDALAATVQWYRDHESWWRPRRQALATHGQLDPR